MNRIAEAFLSILCSALAHVEIADPDLSGDDWTALLRLADQHQLLPLVYDAAYRCDSFRRIPYEYRKEMRDRAVFAVIRQEVQTNEFLNLILACQRQKLDPIVLKGVVCRTLYPSGRLRPSVDEDLLISAEELDDYHACFLSQGLTADDPTADRHVTSEFSYHKLASPTYIELHTELFSTDSKAYGELNSLLGDVRKRSVRITVHDVSLRTLSPTDHILYLLCHAYKHMIYTGFGIRQVCDIVLFARAYNKEILWDRVAEQCDRFRLRKFCAAIFTIGEKHLGFSAPPNFSADDVNELPLLNDILDGGLYGVSDENRLHSSSLTLDAVAADREGRHSGGIWRSVFPPREYLCNRYPYVRRHPALLPVAWGQRMIGYLSHINSAKNVKPAESIRIARERVDLLRQYDILD